MVYDPADERLPMTIFAPLSTPKAQHMASDQHTFGAGVKATAALIPAGWSQTWVLSGGLGINEGFQAWGDLALTPTLTLTLTSTLTLILTLILTFTLTLTRRGAIGCSRSVASGAPTPTVTPPTPP